MWQYRQIGQPCTRSWNNSPISAAGHPSCRRAIWTRRLAHCRLYGQSGDVTGAGSMRGGGGVASDANSAASNAFMGVELMGVRT